MTSDCLESPGGKLVVMVVVALAAVGARTLYLLAEARWPGAFARKVSAGRAQDAIRRALALDGDERVRVRSKMPECSNFTEAERLLYAPPAAKEGAPC